MGEDTTTTAPAAEGTPGEDFDYREVLRTLGPIAALGGSIVLIRLLLALLVRTLKAAANMKQTPGPVEEGDDSKPKGAGRAAKAKAKQQSLQDLLEGIGMAALCAGITAGITGTLGTILWSLLTPWHSYIIGVGIAAWYVSALVVAPQRKPRPAAEKAAPAAADEDEAGDEEADEDDELYDDEGEDELHEENDAPRNDHEMMGEQRICVEHPNDALARLALSELLAAIGTGRKGVHLATMIESMAPGWDVAALRQRLASIGIPSRKLQIRNVGNTWGLHVDDVTKVFTVPLEEVLATLTGNADRARSGTPTVAVQRLLPPPASSTSTTALAEAVQAPAPAACAAPLPAPAGTPTEGPGGAPAEAQQRPAMARILHLAKGPSPDQVA
ncbi:hypothetical protein [Kitasatospora sp. NPDC058046]|uniref:hypothetical protein n=1 Tax=Kitasatospora sp. NPDC058046 TaxID=3346312 RepID=UPI0036DF75C2